MTSLVKLIMYNVNIFYNNIVYRCLQCRRENINVHKLCLKDVTSYTKNSIWTHKRTYFLQLCRQLTWFTKHAPKTMFTIIVSHSHRHYKFNNLSKIVPSKDSRCSLSWSYTSYTWAFLPAAGMDYLWVQDPLSLTYGLRCRAGRSENPSPGVHTRVCRRPQGCPDPGPWVAGPPDMAGRGSALLSLYGKAWVIQLRYNVKSC